jgi:hypothetical protein
MAIDVHLHGLTLSVTNVRLSMKFTARCWASRSWSGGKVKRVTPAMRAGRPERLGRLLKDVASTQGAR